MSPLTIERIHELLALYEDGLFTKDELLGRVARESVIPMLESLDTAPVAGWMSSACGPEQPPKKRAIVEYDAYTLLFRREEP